MLYRLRCCASVFWSNLKFYPNINVYLAARPPCRCCTSASTQSLQVRGAASTHQREVHTIHRHQSTDHDNKYTYIMQ